MWFEIQLRQPGTPDRFPLFKATSKEDAIRYAKDAHPWWEIIDVKEIPSCAQGKKEGQ